MTGPIRGPAKYRTATHTKEWPEQLPVAPPLENTAGDGKKSKETYNEKGKRTEEREHKAKGNYHIRRYKIIKWQKKVEPYW